MLQGISVPDLIQIIKATVAELDRAPADRSSSTPAAAAAAGQSGSSAPPAEEQQRDAARRIAAQRRAEQLAEIAEQRARLATLAADLDRRSAEIDAHGADAPGDLAAPRGRPSALAAPLLTTSDADAAADALSADAARTPVTTAPAIRPNGSAFFAEDAASDDDSPPAGRIYAPKPLSEESNDNFEERRLFLEDVQSGQDGLYNHVQRSQQDLNHLDLLVRALRRCDRDRFDAALPIEIAGVEAYRSKEEKHDGVAPPEARLIPSSYDKEVREVLAPVARLLAPTAWLLDHLAALLDEGHALEEHFLRQLAFGCRNGVIRAVLQLDARYTAMRNEYAHADDKNAKDTIAQLHYKTMVGASDSSVTTRLARYEAEAYPIIAARAVSQSLAQATAAARLPAATAAVAARSAAAEPAASQAAGARRGGGRGSRGGRGGSRQQPGPEAATAAPAAKQQPPPAAAPAAPDAAAAAPAAPAAHAAAKQQQPRNPRAPRPAAPPAAAGPAPGGQ